MPGIAPQRKKALEQFKLDEEEFHDRHEFLVDPSNAARSASTSISIALSSIVPGPLPVKSSKIMCFHSRNPIGKRWPWRKNWRSQENI